MFRGTSASQDVRFRSKKKTMLQKIGCARVLDKKVNLTNGHIKMEYIYTWVSKRITELLGAEDEILIGMVTAWLEKEDLDPKDMQLELLEFLDKKTPEFMKELWSLLVSAQEQESGIPLQFVQDRMKELSKNQDKNEVISERLKEISEKVANENDSSEPAKTEETTSEKNENKEEDESNSSRRNVIQLQKCQLDLNARFSECSFGELFGEELITILASKSKKKTQANIYTILRCIYTLNGKDRSERSERSERSDRRRRSKSRSRRHERSERNRGERHERRGDERTDDITKSSSSRRDRDRRDAHRHRDSRDSRDRRDRDRRSDRDRYSRHHRSRSRERRSDREVREEKTTSRKRRFVEEENNEAELFGPAPPKDTKPAQESDDELLNSDSDSDSMWDGSDDEKEHSRSSKK
eukprot:TRINITY_DN921_c0_g1_i3.p1 TRINITY_DN921_c0_g1~~TRINITY_DN921_c0_g1_i3.p1  ORF type:complete len:439 (+),score=105.67 TRINITY_DN921_c0_g1_i3:86-1318(+)